MNMMLDTGATHTVVPEDVLIGLGLRPSGTTPVRTSMHQVTQQPAYKTVVSIELEDLGGTPHLARFSYGVIGRPRSPAATSLPFEGLIGLDILRHFRVRYDGPAQVVELSCDNVLVLPSAGGLPAGGHP
jgi:hypothetical protein